MLRVVFDTVIFVRALINPYGPFGRLVFEYRDRYQLIASAPVLRELIDVVHRPELTRKFRSLAGVDVAAVLRVIDEAESVPIGEIPAVSRDQKDDVFLATARAAGADYLVSEDNDLLVLGAYQGTEIVTAAAFLRILDAERQS